MVRASQDKGRGQALVLAALAMVVLLGLLALAVDGGNAYAQRRTVQNAADAGALAGACALALGENPEPVAVEYAVNVNGADSAEVAVDGQTVTVVASRFFPSFFAGVMGRPTLDATARACVRYGPVGATTGGVFPIAAYWQDFVYGQSYDILAGGGPGNFGWLGWDGCTSATCLCESLTFPGNSENYVNPYDPDDDDLSVGDWVAGSVGTMVPSCLTDLLDALIAGQTRITVVVWDQAQGEGSNLEYRVAGFAAFTLEGYELAGEDSITGRFDRVIEPGGDLATGSGYGAYSLILTE